MNVEKQFSLLFVQQALERVRDGISLLPQNPYNYFLRSPGNDNTIAVPSCHSVSFQYQFIFCNDQLCLKYL